MTDTTRRDALKAGAAALALGAALGPKAAWAAGEPKTVLITGCSSGFGRLSAEALARAGHRVIATMRRVDGANRDAAAELTKMAAAEKLPLQVRELDVLSDASVSAAVQASVDEHGPLDVVVNNAGLSVPGPIEAQSPEFFGKNIETNLVGSLRVAQAALPAMRERGQGLIIQISSVLGRFLIPGLGAYSASKFGVEATFEALAYDLGRFGIEVSIVQPSGYPTKIQVNAQRYMEEMLAEASKTRPEVLTAYQPNFDWLRTGLKPPETDPMDVVRAIRKLVEAEAGARPLRVVVSPQPQAAEAINATAKAVQRKVFEARGVAHPLDRRL